MPEPLGLIVSIGICSSVALWLERASAAWFGGAARRRLDNLRKAVIEIARTEVQLSALVSRFEKLLMSDTSINRCTMLFSQGQRYVGTSLSLDRDRPGFAALADMGWTTPESLARRRPTPALRDLSNIIDTQCLGAIISLPKGSPTPSIVIAFGRRKDDAPYTYPEIERLQNVATLIDNMLAHARRISHTAMVARMEYLALASRGLAHDLKNLITPISSFLDHTVGVYPPSSPAGDVHSLAKCAAGVINGYLRESLFFTQKLAPHIERFAAKELIEEVRSAAEMQSKACRVEIITRSLTEGMVSADRVLLLRTLLNLVSNAIEASQPGGEVVLTVKQTVTARVRFEVADQGSGIAPEHLSQIFDPYFTTKDFGSELRGFGLGLTIAQKIVLMHGGDISVSSSPESGTLFVVEIPESHDLDRDNSERKLPGLESMSSAGSPASP
ncbi:MAG: hypothetical protein GDA68_23035 [Nitrospira sp. CR2.1]|nr:hypothetical protein [Nitrospira sp. CR2.1]